MAKENLYRILLINPPNSISIKSDFVVNIFQPIGLAYIAAVLEKNKYPVKILDALALGYEKEKIIGNRKIIGLDYKDIEKEIISYKPDIVGITTPFSFQSKEAHQIAKIVKKINPKITTIAGGSHATIQPEEILNDKNFDFVTRGEGEYVIIDLLKALKNKTPLKNIKGVSYKNKKGKIINNPSALPIHDLDKIPLPARHLLPMDKYFQAAKKGRVIEGMLSFGNKRTSIFTSRGCPFTCTFCSVHLTMTRIWRSRSPENVIAEIKECINKYDIKYFDILDDNFTLDPNRAKKICRLIIKEKLNIQWSTPNGIRADKIDEELIKLMKKSGCIQIKVAPESGNIRVLNTIIKKHLDLDMVKKTVSLCKKHHLSVEAFFVLGFPEETIDEIIDTINFAKQLRKLGCDYCYFFTATPYFGTEMYSEAIKKGYLDESKYKIEKIATTNNNFLLKSPNYSSKELSNLLKIAAKVNPPITKIRLLAGLKMFTLDPLRIIKYAIGYMKSFLP
jgi:anaerobic magnesium-protoporphyrin IX monomethyl ester cyclase